MLNIYNLIHWHCCITEMVCFELQIILNRNLLKLLHKLVVRALPRVYTIMKILDVKQSFIKLLTLGL